MATLLPAAFASKWTRLFADNVFQNINGPLLAEFVADVRDSFAAGGEVNVPDWKEGTYYREGFVILYSVTKSFYKAIERGYLIAPDSSGGDSVWEPTLSPAGAGALYQVGTVEALQAVRGSWAPGRLYVLLGRTDPATGAALDDVYVRALSAGQLELTGYTIGNDSLAAEPQPVSYDLATDTTSPVEVGAVDAYTKEEADELLAGKGSSVVQQQHTQQLNTLGAKAANLYAHYADNSVAPFNDLDSYLTAASLHGGTLRLEGEATALSISTANRGGWPAFWDAAGSTIFVPAGQPLKSGAVGLLNFNFGNFFLDGGGSFLLNGQLPQDTPPGQASRLFAGWSNIPLDNAANVVRLEGGYYKKIRGAGKYYLTNNVQVDDWSEASNVVDLRQGSGGGGGGSTGDAYTKAETDQKDSALQQQIDDINLNGGPVLQKFVFEPGYADSYTFTAGADVVGVYGTEGLSNVSGVSYYRGLAITALPLTIQQGDKIRIDITRQNSTQVASVVLSK